MGQFFQQRTGGEGAHVLQRLPDGRQTGNDVGGGLNVVEAEDRDVFGDFETSIVKRADAADGGDVVEAEQGGEVVFRWMQ